MAQLIGRCGVSDREKNELECGTCGVARWRWLVGYRECEFRLERDLEVIALDVVTDSLAVVEITQVGLLRAVVLNLRHII